MLAIHWRASGFVLKRWLNARRDLAIACEAAGIGRVTPNDLRRTFASWLKHRNVNSKTVADLLGHTSTGMVDHVYGHLDDPSLIRAVETLSPMPEPGSKWVTNQGQSLRQGRRMRLSPSKEIQQLAARPEGVEPPTFGFEVRRSIQLSYGR